MPTRIIFPGSLGAGCKTSPYGYLSDLTVVILYVVESGNARIHSKAASKQYQDEIIVVLVILVDYPV